MATLYVENVPDALYEALRARARQHRKSMAAEVLSLLAENIPTTEELKRRRQFLKQLARFRAQGASAKGAFPRTEEVLGEEHRR
jgi:plasmid stability protein